jgi:hypothetical protein
LGKARQRKSQHQERKDDCHHDAPSFCGLFASSRLDEIHYGKVADA